MSGSIAIEVFTLGHRMVRARSVFLRTIADTMRGIARRRSASGQKRTSFKEDRRERPDVPRIHRGRGVDGRNKSGHDEHVD
jgi:hypothetical protein